MCDVCKLKIIIVDDDQDSLDGLEFSLTTFGHTVRRFSDPILALASYKEEKCDVVISDYKMPGMSGLELLEALKEFDADAQVILVTAFGTLQMVIEALNKKVAHFLNKPIDIDELFGYLDEISKEKKMPTPPGKLCGDREPSLVRSEIPPLSYPETRGNVNKSICIGKKVLLIDDDAAFTQLLMVFLTKKGYSVKSVASGERGLWELENGNYDLCLLDINLPDLNGLRLVAEMRRSGNDLNTCIAMSGAVDNALRLRCLELGINEILEKPFSLNTLSEAMERMLLYRYQNFITPAEMVNITNNQLLMGMNSLISALEARDRYTRGHSETVANIVAAVLSFHNFPGEEVTQAYIGARLHDIGKIGIKDSVLLKTAPLTEEEYRHIRQHPVIGAHIVNGLPCMESLIPIILMHHERFDGSGYPFGLNRRETPFLARITAVADTYDAITSDRSYRERSSPAEALRIIAEMKGKQFCPEAVELFMAWIVQMQTKDESLFSRGYKQER